MVGVLLVEVVLGLGAQLWRQLVEDAGEDAVDRVLLGGVAVPDGDEVGVEADGEADAAELVAWLGVSTQEVQAGRGLEPRTHYHRGHSAASRQ